MRSAPPKPGGYDARVAPARLSAGERQLIALARAYLSPAPVAILDEATCHLDPAAEERAEAAFARRGGTLIVIAHRITSARRARRILVLDGVRAQAGEHEELLVTSPMYRDLAGYWTAARPQAPSPAARGCRGHGKGLRPAATADGQARGRRRPPWGLTRGRRPR